MHDEGSSSLRPDKFQRPPHGLHFSTTLSGHSGTSDLRGIPIKDAAIECDGYEAAINVSSRHRDRRQ
eukprot:6195638-Pleurochrysis_carterae.AAC.5